MNDKIIYGQAEICWNGELITCDNFEEISVEIAQDSTDIESLCGIIGSVDKTPTIEVKATILRSNIDVLSKLFPHLYNPAAGSAYGNIIVGASSCAVVDPYGELNIHNTCDTNDDDDIHLFYAKPLLNSSFTYNADDPRKIEVTWKGYVAPSTNPNAGSVFRIGTGDLTQESIYDCATETTVAV